MSLSNPSAEYDRMVANVNMQWADWHVNEAIQPGGVAVVCEAFHGELPATLPEPRRGRLRHPQPPPRIDISLSNIVLQNHHPTTRKQHP